MSGQRDKKSRSPVKNRRTEANSIRFMSCISAMCRHSCQRNSLILPNRSAQLRARKPIQNERVHVTKDSTNVPITRPLNWAMNPPSANATPENPGVNMNTKRRNATTSIGWTRFKLIVNIDTSLAIVQDICSIKYISCTTAT